MTDKPSIRELIDACRADRHDPQRPELPELAPLARELAANPQLQPVIEQAERFDRNVRAALDDVELPAGLADRLLAGCEAAVVTPAKSEESTDDAATKKWSRRQVLAMFSAAASVLIALVGGWQLMTYLKPRPVSNDTLAQTAIAWFDLSGPQLTWQSYESAPVTQYPLARTIRYRPARWARLNNSTVVYDLTNSGTRALLFVQRTNRPHPGLKSFMTRLSSSGGIALGAWQRTEVVYVLAVIEGEQRIDDYLRKVPEA